MANFLEALKKIAGYNAIDEYEKKQKDASAGSEPVALPNGGLEGEALKNELAVTPGPVATTGLNPNNPGPEDSRKSLFDRVSNTMQNKLQDGSLDNSQPDEIQRKLAAVSKIAGAPQVNQEATPPVNTPQQTQPLDPYGDDLNDAALKAAQERANTQRMLAGFLGAGDTLVKAVTEGRVKPGEFTERFAKQANQGVTDIMDRRSAKDKELARQRAISEMNDEAAMRDPNSPVSKSIREGLKNLFPKMSLPDNVSAKQLRDVGINYGTLIAAKETADQRRDTALERQSLANERLQLRKDDKLDKDITKHSERMSKAGVSSAVETLQEIDSLLDGGLDATKGDIPGYGLADGMMPDVAVSERAQKLRQAVQRLANITLKDRSGAAVTDQEYKRFQKEFGSGTFSTEKQLLSGLRQYRNILGRVTKELEASADPGALKEYQGRPGSVRSDLIPGIDKVAERKASQVGKDEKGNTTKDDPRIDQFMKANNIKDRNEAIRILKENGII